MRETVSFGIGFGDEPGYMTLPRTLLPEIERRWPQFVYATKRGAKVEIEMNSPDYLAWKEIMERYGHKFRLTNTPGEKDRPMTILLGAHREFDDADFTKTNLFSFLFPEKRIADDTIPKVRPPVVKSATIRQASCGFTTPGGLTLCNEEFRDLLIAEKFRGLTLQEVGYEGRRRPRRRLWMMDSDVILPPVTNPLLDVEDGNSAEAGRADVTLEDIFRPWVFHYRDKDLEAVGTFDFGRTQTFHVNKWGYIGDHYFVVSRRFKDYMSENRIKIKWAPVYVD